MIVCSGCAAENAAENKFCEACGTTLAAPVQPRKRMPQTMLVDPPKIADAAVYLSLLDGKRFELTGDGQFGIGRTDAASQWYPKVDLAPHGGEPGGVSRQHARIEVNAGKAYVFDMGSSNGTTLNGRKLEANTRYSLRTGDELLFGRILARIEIS